jgi:hypothetical protein
MLILQNARHRNHSSVIKILFDYSKTALAPVSRVRFTDLSSFYTQHRASGLRELVGGPWLLPPNNLDRSEVGLESVHLL